jgi:hypothetical protein
MTKPLGDPQYLRDGDGNEFEVKRVCAQCKATRRLPPQPWTGAAQPAERHCEACGRSGYVTERFKDVAALRAYVGSL